MEQDPDVLDTWFSSALWPFSTLGWPEKTPELEHFYPTSVLVTARDIIFFWVARMVFMGLEFMEEIPFADVLMHGLVLDKDGKKMSKSRPETIVDPQDVIDEYGADILRFTLATGTALGQDQRFQMERVEGARNFANKIWNAARFLRMNLDDYEEAKGEEEDGFTLPDQYILSRLQRVTAEAGEMIDRYDLGGAANLLYDFIWSEYCDWYIEAAKPQLKADGAVRRRTQQVLVKVFRQIMVLLHPFMPFITEEIWQALPYEGESVMVAPWPEPDENSSTRRPRRKMGLLMEVTRAIRNIRAEAGWSPAESRGHPSGWAGGEEILEENRLYLEVPGLWATGDPAGRERQPEQAVSAVVTGVEVYLPLAGLVDLEKEKERLEKELAELEKEKERLEKKLANTQFLAKAPEAVVAKEKEKLAAVEEKYAKVSARLAELKS